jgi:DNA-binding LytR/AlgR family response regulator
LALIADDEPLLAAALAKALQRLWPELRLVTVHDGWQAAQRIDEAQPDVAFLDIQMPGLTGLEVARQIVCATRVVFVTAHEQHAVEAFEANAVDYVLKPLNTERLAKTVERLKASLSQRTSTALDDEALFKALQRLAPAVTPGSASFLRYVRAGLGDTAQQVDVNDVLYFESDEKYTVVRTAQAEHLIRTPLAELNALLDPAHFVQIHRSTIVNLRHVLGTRRDEVSRLHVRIKSHDRELPVSRAYVHLFKTM